MRSLKNKYIISLVTVSLFIVVTPVFADGPYYVDKDATGSNNGSSWVNAWTSFSAINWTTVASGTNKTVYISGGPTSKTYSETLTVGASGTVGTRVTVSIGQDAGHNGAVIINGARSRTTGLNISGRSYLNITGQVGPGITPKLRFTNHTGNGITVGGSSTNVDIGYVESDNNGTTGNTNGIGGVFTYSTNYNLEIHHCSIHDNYQDGMYLVRSNAGLYPTQYGTVRIHHNHIYNINDDGIETSLPLDFYNNDVGPRIYSGGRGHPDQIQSYSSYVRIYNNYFHGSVLTSDPGNSNSNIFSDPFDSDIGGFNPHDIQVFNNLIVESQPPGSSGDYHRGIAMSFAEPGVASANNILVANNTVVGVPFLGMTLTFGSGIGSGNVSNVQVKNNIFYDVGRNTGAAFSMARGNGTITYGTHGSGADVEADYNLVYASSGTYKMDVQWGSIFYTWAGYKSASGADSHGILGNPSLNGVYELNTGSIAIDKGVSISSYFTTDKNGISRPQGSAWDIGAYEGISTITPIPNFPSSIQIN